MLLQSKVCGVLEDGGPSKAVVLKSRSTLVSCGHPKASDWLRLHGVLMYSVWLFNVKSLNMACLEISGGDEIWYRLSLHKTT